MKSALALTRSAIPRPARQAASLLRPSVAPASHGLSLSTAAASAARPPTAQLRAFSSSPFRSSQVMQAVQIEGGVGPSSALHIGEIERPVPEEGEVLVKVGPSSTSAPTPS